MSCKEAVGEEEALGVGVEVRVTQEARLYKDTPSHMREAGGGGGREMEESARGAVAP